MSSGTRPLRITERVDYALKSVLLLCLHEDRYLTASAIADQLGLSRKMLGSVLSNLVAAGILESRIGWHGGFRLARKPQGINLGEIIGAVSFEERQLLPNGAFIDNGDTGAKDTHAALVSGLAEECWQLLDTWVQSALATFTIADLISRRLGPLDQKISFRSSTAGS